MESSTKRYLRTPDAAAYLGISASTLEKYRVFGGGPRYHKLGRVVVYLVSDLDAFAQAQPRASTSDSAAPSQPVEHTRRRERGRPKREQSAIGPVGR